MPASCRIGADRQSGTGGSGRFGGKDISPEWLLGMLPDEKAATERFAGSARQDGRVRPRCGHDRACVAKRPDTPRCCPPCKGHFGAKTGTVMQRSKISRRKWAIATHPAATQRARPACGRAAARARGKTLHHACRTGFVIRGRPGGTGSVTRSGWGGRSVFWRTREQACGQKGRGEEGGGCVQQRPRGRGGQGRAGPRDRRGQLGGMRRGERGKGRQDMHRRAQIIRRAGEPRDRQPRRRGIRPGRGARQLNGAGPGPGGARPQRDIPPHGRRAPAPPHQRACGAAEHEGVGHRRQDAQDGPGPGWLAARIQASCGRRRAVRPAAGGIRPASPVTSGTVAAINQAGTTRRGQTAMPSGPGP